MENRRAAAKVGTATIDDPAAAASIGDPAAVAADEEESKALLLRLAGSKKKEEVGMKGGGEVAESPSPSAARSGDGSTWWAENCYHHSHRPQRMVNERMVNERMVNERMVNERMGNGNQLPSKEQIARPLLHSSEQGQLMLVGDGMVWERQQ
jgi:hypothetical protein